jgi:hypothetical protein
LTRLRSHKCWDCWVGQTLVVDKNTVCFALASYSYFIRANPFVSCWSILWLSPSFSSRHPEFRSPLFLLSSPFFCCQIPMIQMCVASVSVMKLPISHRLGFGESIWWLSIIVILFTVPFPNSFGDANSLTAPNSRRAGWTPRGKAALLSPFFNGHGGWEVHGEVRIFRDLTIREL